MWREKIEKLSIQIWQSILEAEGVLGAVRKIKQNHKDVKIKLTR
jgi:hypothetical protein